jgi:hypothetical protein
MAWNRLVFAMVFALGATAAAAQGGTGGARVAEQRLGGDLFIAGAALSVGEPVPGDLIASGGSLDVDAPVAGDALAMGGKLRLGMDVGQSVYAAAGQITVNAKVGRNLRVAGGQVELGPKSEVAGNVSIAAGQVRLTGSVHGQVQVAGGRVLIDGPVGGDVLATAGEVELGPNARIAGKLRYRSREALRQDPAAQVGGGIEQLLPAIGRDGVGHRAPRARIVRWLWTAGLIVLAGVVLAALPGACSQVARTLRERPGLSVLLGFVMLVCVPVAALLLLVTLIGIPLGLLAMALYLALLPVAYVGGCIALGDAALQRWKPDRVPSLGWRIAAAATVLVALALLRWVPWLGGVIGFAVLLAGLGALVLQARRLVASALPA